MWEWVRVVGGAWGGGGGGGGGGSGGLVIIIPLVKLGVQTKPFPEVL